MKVIEYLKDAKVFYAATADGDQPHVRPIGFVMEFEGQPAFYTDARKKMCKQMKANPKMEFCAIDGKMNTLRFTGEAKFITSLESKKAALEAMPMLAKAGYSVEDDVFEIYTLENVSLSYVNMAGKQPDGVEL